MIEEGKELNDVVCAAYKMGCDQTREVYQKRIEKLEAALLNVMVGGNHVALLIGVGHPPHTATHDKALTHYGAGDAYDAWCCWKTIMEARKALEGKDD
jgi:hypothetical protein